MHFHPFPCITKPFDFNISLSSRHFRVLVVVFSKHVSSNNASPNRAWKCWLNTHFCIVSVREAKFVIPPAVFPLFKNVCSPTISTTCPIPKVFRGTDILTELGPPLLQGTFYLDFLRHKYKTLRTWVNTLPAQKSPIKVTDIDCIM